MICLISCCFISIDIYSYTYQCLMHKLYVVLCMHVYARVCMCVFSCESREAGVKVGTTTTREKTKPTTIATRERRKKQYKWIEMHFWSYSSLSLSPSKNNEKKILQK